MCGYDIVFVVVWLCERATASFGWWQSHDYIMTVRRRSIHGTSICVCAWTCGVCTWSVSDDVFHVNIHHMLFVDAYVAYQCHYSWLTSSECIRWSKLLCICIRSVLIIWYGGSIYEIACCYVSNTNTTVELHACRSQYLKHDTAENTCIKQYTWRPPNTSATTIHILCKR